MSTPPINLRSLATDDRSFLLHSWLRSYRNGPFTRLIPNNLYYEAYHSVLEGLLASADIFIACDPDSPRRIFGYLVTGFAGEAPVLFYVYVKQAYRGFGIARQLLAAARFDVAKPFFFPFLSPQARSLAQHFPQAVFNPFLIEPSK